MIAGVLPEGVKCVETFGDVEAPLYPGESALLERSVDKRQREFRTTRHCARLALMSLGQAPGPVLTGAHGAPRWPTGVVGSMTHCHGYRAAAVSLVVAAIGIDAEPAAPLPEDLLDLIALPQDVTALPSNSDQPWDRILFSAKESVYKAWFPLAGRWLGFDDAEVQIDPAGTFLARLLVPGPPGTATFAGRWAADRGFIGTAVVVPRSAPLPDCTQNSL